MDPLLTQLLIPSVCVLCFFLEAHFSQQIAFLVGHAHCSQNPQIFFFNKIFIKNESHGTIYTFKNYFVIVFLVFSKISGIQTDLNIINLKMCKLLCHLKFQ